MLLKKNFIVFYLGEAYIIIVLYCWKLSVQPVCSEGLNVENRIYFIQVDFIVISSEKISIRRFLSQGRALNILGLEKSMIC